MHIGVDSLHSAYLMFFIRFLIGDGVLNITLFVLAVYMDEKEMGCRIGDGGCEGVVGDEYIADRIDVSGGVSYLDARGESSLGAKIISKIDLEDIVWDSSLSSEDAGLLVESASTMGCTGE